MDLCVVICNRSLFKRSVTLFLADKYEMAEENFFYVASITSFNSKEYICSTCDKKIKLESRVRLCAIN